MTIWQKLPSDRRWATQPILASILPLQEVSQAYELNQGRHSRGQLVLEIVGQ